MTIAHDKIKQQAHKCRSNITFEITDTVYVCEVKSLYKNLFGF